MDNRKNRIAYLEAASKIDRFALVIVGQDPYPKEANGIAFCKNRFEELFDTYCCGKEVLYSLGYSKEYILSNYENPIALFFDLLAKGVAFINVSSVLLKDATNATLNADKTYNENFLSKTDQIVILGKTNATQVFKQYFPKHEITKSLIHPSGNARKYDPVDWSNTWNKSFLKTTFLPIFIAKQKTMELDFYFDLDIPSFQLYSKGDTVEGVHGIELVNGEYFASHFHLKTKIAKRELKTQLDKTPPKELFSMASKENDDFKSWPEVKYEGDSYFIKKYKFSWLLDYINNTKN